MDDIIYIYDRMTFISGIKNVSISRADNMICEEIHIYKDEIQHYIKEFKIKMNNNSNFKLSDA